MPGARPKAKASRSFGAATQDCLVPPGTFRWAIREDGNFETAEELLIIDADKLPAKFTQYGKDMVRYYVREKGIEALVKPMYSTPWQKNGWPAMRVDEGAMYVKIPEGELMNGEEMGGLMCAAHNGNKTAKSRAISLGLCICAAILNKGIDFQWLGEYMCEEDFKVLVTASKNALSDAKFGGLNPDAADNGDPGPGDAAPPPEHRDSAGASGDLAEELEPWVELKEEPGGNEDLAEELRRAEQEKRAPEEACASGAARGRERYRPPGSAPREPGDSSAAALKTLQQSGPQVLHKHQHLQKAAVQQRAQLVTTEVSLKQLEEERERLRAELAHEQESRERASGRWEQEMELHRSALQSTEVSAQQAQQAVAQNLAIAANKCSDASSEALYYKQHWLCEEEAYRQQLKLGMEAARERDDWRQQLQYRVAEHSEAASELRDSRGSLEQAMLLCRQRDGELHSEREQLQHERAKRETFQRQAARLSKHLEGAEAKVQEERGKAQDACRKLKALEAARGAEGDMQALANALEAHEQQVELEQQLEALGQEREQLTTALAETRAQLQTLRAESASSDKARQEAEVKRDEYKQQCDSLQRALDSVALAQHKASEFLDSVPLQRLAAVEEPAAKRGRWSARINQAPEGEALAQPKVGVGPFVCRHGGCGRHFQSPQSLSNHERFHVSNAASRGLEHSGSEAQADLKAEASRQRPGRPKGSGKGGKRRAAQARGVDAKSVSARRSPPAACQPSGVVAPGTPRAPATRARTSGVVAPGTPRGVAARASRSGVPAPSTPPPLPARPGVVAPGTPKGAAARVPATPRGVVAPGTPKALPTRAELPASSIPGLSLQPPPETLPEEAAASPQTADGARPKRGRKLTVNNLMARKDKKAPTSPKQYVVTAADRQHFFKSLCERVIELEETDCCSICSQRLYSRDAWALIDCCDHLFHHGCIVASASKDPRCTRCRKTINKVAKFDRADMEEIVLDRNADSAKLHVVAVMPAADQTVCEICGEPGKLLLCDGCGDTKARGGKGRCNWVCHVQCAGLKEVPKGKWYCPRCRST